MEQDITEAIVHLVLQLAIILVAAKVGGEVCLRLLKVPPVLGELAVGVLIGPFALGAIEVGSLGALFPKPQAYLEAGAGIPLSHELYAFAQVASIVLLFTAGLETDLKLFLRYAGPATLVALGGVALPFAFGVGATVLMGFASSWMDPAALFMGAVMTATSVGITARVLSDLGRMDTPEGVTVVGAAVVDDVLGILVLTVVVGVSAAGGVSAAKVALIGGKAIGFWVALTGLGILASRPISRLMGAFRVAGAEIALALALALLGAALAESFGLAMIIGAYSVGLALSTTRLKRELDEPIMAVYHTLVPVFFVAMGMLVDLPAMGGALVFGLVITALAIVSKVVGCGLPALATGFTALGAARVGVGMLPRGEVALIVAGIGLTRGVIEGDLFGVSILMTVVTTLLAPIMLVPLFRRRGPGRRREDAAPAQASAATGGHGDGDNS
ncbi:MAG: cation:proton antiporter [Chloroflexi bacterium]|nr:cation:proton antiporter [Chloroflexota bacterium]